MDLGQVGGPAQELAKAMYEVRTSGMRGADALAVLKAAAAEADTETRPAPHREQP